MNGIQRLVLHQQRDMLLKSFIYQNQCLPEVLFMIITVFFRAMGIWKIDILQIFAFYPIFGKFFQIWGIWKILFFLYS